MKSQNILITRWVMTNILISAHLFLVNNNIAKFHQWQKMSVDLPSAEKVNLIFSIEHEIYSLFQQFYPGQDAQTVYLHIIGFHHSLDMSHKTILLILMLNKILLTISSYH